MKPLISRLSQHSTLTFFPLLLFLRWKWKNYILLVLGMVILAGCFRKFYNTGTTSTIDASRIEQLKAANKYFIIHYKDSVRSLDNIFISNQELNGKSRELSAQHSKELKPETDKPNVFKDETRSAVLSEVHLYVNNNMAETAGYPDVRIPLSDIYRMDVYEFDKGRTSTSTALSIVGIVVPIALVIIVAASSSGGSSTPAPSATGQECACPLVYVEQKGNFDFQNGIFSGAMYANLERPDYLSLEKIQPENSIIHLRISGHGDEIQYLNSAQLIGVYHQPNSKILADRQGKFYSITNPELPEEITGSDNKNLKEVLSKADTNSFEFNTSDLNEDFSKAYLTFRTPLKSGKAKFLIRAKNSDWAAMVNQEYTLLFGEEYSHYRDKWEHINKNKMEDYLLKQGIPIKVYVENGDKWEYAGYFPLVGTEGYRDMVMEINLPENDNKQFRIKLETAYRFWDLDYAAIDYSEGETLQTITSDPVSAQHILKGDQKKQLFKTDNIYAQLNNDEVIDLEFKVSGKAGNNNISYFLVSSGYYHIRNTYPVKANISRIKKFNKPGEFDRFSKEKYKEMEQFQSLATKGRYTSN